MAKTIAKKNTIKQNNLVDFNFPFTKKNWILIFSGIGLLILGYALMATSISKDPANNDGIWNNSLAVNIAPIILTIAYCIVIPTGIMLRDKSTESIEQI
ncbi:MAG: DUF3098 domain-containing protein [Chlorobiota bacterium]|jgi:cytochrome c-type biogenesis protein CcmH/NrfF|nr:DUF3098 domain-containing protein [Chlorobiota bacterium]QQS66910.1 MAG: DUF3098 domain-containing protein [Chlorobiota bacterium]